MANSTFPSLVKAFHAPLVVLTLMFTNCLSTVVNVRDVPVFAEDLNTSRDTIGVGARLVGTESIEPRIPIHAIAMID